MAAPADGTQDNGLERAVAGAVAVIPSLAGGTLRRARHEAGGIWRDARQLSGRDVDINPADMSSSDRLYFAWYGGLSAMAALRLIEWRLAAVIAAAHTVERYGHRERLREFFGGIGAGV